MGGRWYIITQLAVYTTYTTYIPCQLDDEMLPIPPIKLWREPGFTPLTLESPPKRGGLEFNPGCWGFFFGFFKPRYHDFFQSSKKFPEVWKFRCLNISWFNDVNFLASKPVKASQKKPPETKEEAALKGQDLVFFQWWFQIWYLLGIYPPYLIMWGFY